MMPIFQKNVRIWPFHACSMLKYGNASRSTKVDGYGPYFRRNSAIPAFRLANGIGVPKPQHHMVFRHTDVTREGNYHRWDAIEFDELAFSNFHIFNYVVLSTSGGYWPISANYFFSNLRLF